MEEMTEVYAHLSHVEVKPLHFSAKDLSGERLLAMMKVDDNERMPFSNGNASEVSKN